MREVIGAPLPPADKPRHARGIAAIHAQLSDAAFTDAWNTGGSLPIAEIIARW